MQLERFPLDGVPSAPPFTTNAPDEPVLTPKAVATPVPNPLTPVPIAICDQEAVPLPFVVSAYPLVPPLVGSVNVHAAEEEAEDATVVGKAPTLVLASVSVPAVVL